MTRSSFRPALVTALLVVTTALAVTADDEPTVDDILARHVEARGGTERLRAIDNVVYSAGQYSEPGYTSDGNSMMIVGRPYYKLVGNPQAPGSYMEGYDGAAWEWFADPGIVVRTVGAAAGAMRRGADVEGPLVNHRAKGSRIELAEAVEIGGRPAYQLVVTLADGFERLYFIDQETYLVTAERRTAPIHAYGTPVSSETRVGDYRPVEGVLFAHSYVATEIATGKELSRMQWGRIEANRELPEAWHSPPRFERTPYQRFLEQLFGERADAAAVMWSYREFRRAHPELDIQAGIERVGFQMLKMGDTAAAVALLEANAESHPESASAAFGLGRALADAGRPGAARLRLERALELDPDHRDAAREIEELAAAFEPPDTPLAFLAPFIGDWGPDPESDFVREDPARADFVAFRFEWADPARKLLRFFEGLPGGDYERRILENLVAFDPRSGDIHGLGYQLRNDFLYESTFRPADSGFVREYTVTYPPQQEFRNEEDRDRGWIRYRDRCELESRDRLHCTTEQRRGDEWVPWGPAEGYTLVRR